MGKVPKILLCLAIFISAAFLCGYHFSSLKETNLFKDTFVQDIETAENIYVQSTKQAFFEGNSLIVYTQTKEDFCAQDKVKMSYCVQSGGETCTFDFYILSGESAKDIILYLGKTAVAYGWFSDAALTCEFDFSLALYCDTTLYAQKTFLFEEGGEKSALLINNADDLILLEKISNEKIYGQVIDAQSLSYISLSVPFASFNYALTADISFTDWIPFFSGEKSFCGSFEGGGNTLNLNGSFSGSYGLFGSVENCVIKNLNLDVNFILCGSGIELNCGAVAALSLEGVYMENLKVKGNISAFDRGAASGGLVGRATGQLYIDDCVSGVNIGTIQNAGGFIGIFSPLRGCFAPLYIRNCIFEGKIAAEGEGNKNIGGFVGQIAHDTLSANFINCTNNGTLELNSSASSVGGIVGYCFNNLPVMTLSLENCVNNSDIVCAQGNRIGGLLGWAKCLNIEIQNCANYGEINCENVLGAQNICGGLAGYIDTPCLSVKILNSLNYGSIKSFGYAAALAGCINAQNCKIEVINCINAALVCCPLSQNNLLNSLSGEDLILKGCVDLDAYGEDLNFQNELKGIDYGNYAASKGEYSCWKYLFESPLLLPLEIFLKFDLPLQNAEIYRYSYYFDAADEKILCAEGAVSDAVIEGNSVSFAAQELSFYIIKVYSQGKEGFDYFFLEVKYLDCEFTLRLEQEGSLCAIFEEKEEIWRQNYWSDNFYSLYIEGLEQEERYTVKVVFDKTQLIKNAEGAYIIDARQEGIIAVNVYYQNVLLKSVSLTFENDYELPQDLAAEDNPLAVESASQLIDYLAHTKGGKRQTGEALYFVITQNIYFTENFSGVTDFYGVLDGGGYSLYFQGGENKAFITNLYGEIKNINLENISRQTNELYDALLCVNIYAGASVKNVNFISCSLGASRNSLGLGILAARVLGNGDVTVENCGVYNCTVKSFANASALIGMQGEKTVLFLKNITVRGCFVEAQEENAALLLSYSLGNLSIINCAFEDCSVKACERASCAVARFEGGELFISQVRADKCKVSAQYCAAAIAASLKGQYAKISQADVYYCIITEEGTLYCETGGAGGITGYCAASFLIENCQVLQSVISSRAIYAGAGGIAGVLHAAGEIKFCINSAAVTVYGVFGDAAGIAAYCQKDIVINNCVNLGFVQSPKGRGGGIVSNVLGALSLFNSYNLEKITAKKADALAAQVLGELTLCNAFYYENCAPCSFEGAFAFDGNCSIIRGNENLHTLLEALNSFGENWEIKEGFSFPVFKFLNIDFTHTAEKDFVVLLPKGSTPPISEEIAQDKISQNLQAFYKGITAQETYIFEFLLPITSIGVYKEGVFLCTLYENIFEFTPQSGNDLYTFIVYHEGRLLFTFSAAFDLKFQYEIYNESDLLTFMQGKQKEGYFDTSFIDLEGKYILCAEIDFARCGGILWNPLGSARHPFSGVIAGGGFKIENLKIEGGDYTGFLGFGDNAIIEGLRLSKACVLGQNYSAALVGYAQNCVIKDCTVSGKVCGNGSYVGIILGYGDSKTRVIDCNAGTEQQAAFLFASGEEGAYIGGVAGYAHNVYRCTSYTYINSQSARYVGGVVGAVGKKGVLKGCFAAGEVYYNALNAQSLPYVGYIAGAVCDGAGITNCGYLLIMRYDNAVEVNNIEIFGAKEYSLIACYPDGEGNAENRYKVILNDFCESDASFTYANYAGVTVRLQMRNGLYKFVNTFDIQANNLKTFINIQCGNLTSYARNAPLTVDAALNAVEVFCANDFEYVAWAVNCGMPLTLKTVEGKEIYYSSSEVRALSIKLMSDIDLTAYRYAYIKNGQVIFCDEEHEGSFALNRKKGESKGEMLFDFYGLGICAQAPYAGTIFGGGHALTVDINLPHSYAAGVIAYAAKAQGGACFKDLTLFGFISGGKYAGAAGVLTTYCEDIPLCFENVRVNLSFKARYGAGLAGAAYDCPLVNIKNCVINANFDCHAAAAYLGTSIYGQNITLCFLGENKDYTLLDYALSEETVTEGKVYRTVKVCYGLGQGEYVEVFTTSFDAQSITVNSLTIAGATYIFEPFTLVFKDGNTFKKIFYLFILKGELTKIYDESALLHLGQENYLGSWNIFNDAVYAQDGKAEENKAYGLSFLNIEKEPLIVCASTFKVCISKAGIEVIFETDSSLIYNACYHNYFAVFSKENCGYSLQYYLIEEGVFTQLNHSPKDAARYRVKILLNDENFYMSGQDYLDFEIRPLEVFVSFPQDYPLQKTWGAGDTCWDSVLFDAPLQNIAEKIEVNFFKEMGENVGSYSVFALSADANYIVNLKEPIYFEIVKATPLLYFKNTQKIYNKKAENFTAFLEGVKGEKQPSGQAHYFYYMDENLTLPTTPPLSGAETAGGAPAFAGVYYVKVMYYGDDNYTCAYAVAMVQITKASPQFSPPLAASIYAGQSLFDSELYGGTGAGIFLWEENIFFSYADDFYAFALFEPFDQVNYSCVQFEIVVSVSWLTVTFNDAQKSECVNVLYGESVDKESVPMSQKTGYSCRWEDVCTQNVTDFVVVNALYTLLPPLLEIEGKSEVIYGEEVILTAMASHPLNNLSFLWYKEGCDFPISNLYTLSLSNVNQSGAYTVVVSVYDNGNFSSVQKSVNVKIKPAQLNIQFLSYSGVYDGGYHGITLDAPIDSEVSYSLDGISWSAVNPLYKNVCDLMVYLRVSKENYDDFFAMGYIKIARRAVKITIDNKQSAYMSEFVPLTYTLTEGEIIAEDKSGVYLFKESGLDAGGYLISGRFDNENYFVEFTEGIYTITPLDLHIGEIAFTDGVKEHNGSALNLAVSGLPQGLSADYFSDSLCTQVFSGAYDKGVYDIYAKIYCPSGNYLIEGEEFLVLNAKLTVIVAVRLWWEIEQNIVYCGGDLSGFVKAFFQDEMGGIISVPLTFAKGGEQRPFKDAGEYAVYAYLGEFYTLKEGDQNVTVNIKKAQIDLKDIRFENLTVNFDNGLKRIEISGELAQGVFVEYYCGDALFFGASQEGEYVICAYFFAGENYLSCEMTAKLIINRNAQLEEAFKEGVLKMGKVTLSHYQYLKELSVMYEEIIYKEDLAAAKQKLDSAIEEYNLLAANAQLKKDEAQAVLQKIFLPLLRVLEALAYTFKFSILALACLKAVNSIKKK